MSGTAEQEERAKWRANERADRAEAENEKWKEQSNRLIRHLEGAHRCEHVYGILAQPHSAALFAARGREAAAEIETWPAWMRRNLWARKLHEHGLECVYPCPILAGSPEPAR